MQSIIFFPTVFDKYCPGSIADNMPSKVPAWCLLMEFQPIGPKCAWDAMKRLSESGVRREMVGRQEETWDRNPPFQ